MSRHIIIIIGRESPTAPDVDANVRVHSSRTMQNHVKDSSNSNEGRMVGRAPITPEKHEENENSQPAVRRTATNPSSTAMVVAGDRGGRNVSVCGGRIGTAPLRSEGGHKLSCGGGVSSETRHSQKLEIFIEARGGATSLVKTAGESRREGQGGFTRAGGMPQTLCTPPVRDIFSCRIL